MRQERSLPLPIFVVVYCVCIEDGVFVFRLDRKGIGE